MDVGAGPITVGLMDMARSRARASGSGMCEKKRRGSGHKFLLAVCVVRSRGTQSELFLSYRESSKIMGSNMGRYCLCPFVGSTFPCLLRASPFHCYYSASGLSELRKQREPRCELPA